MTRYDFLKLMAAAPLGLAADRGPRTKDGPRTADGPGTEDQEPRTSFPSGVTAAVADFIVQSRFDRIPQNALVEAKRCLIDGFGVVLAGATVQGSAIVATT